MYPTVYDERVAGEIILVRKSLPPSCEVFIAQQKVIRKRMLQVTCFYRYIQVTSHVFLQVHTGKHEYTIKLHEGIIPYTTVPSLTELINLCLSSAQVPQIWKHTNVMPHHQIPR